MNTEIWIILGIYAAFALAEAVRTGFFRKQGETGDDAKVELISTIVLLVVTQPLVLFASGAVAGVIAPSAADMLSGLPFVAGIALLLVFDDMSQYWWHRASHSFPWLYNLHRSHHNQEYLSVRVVYRNNLFYYAMMPSLWFSGLLIYLGLGTVYAVYIVIKLTVIIGAHSDVRWDVPLYKIKWLHPLMWIVERTISTPATHSAHHGKHKDDGVTHYKGNFGNLLFFWDVLFGTAKITRRVPEEFGVENLEPVTLGEQLAWPLFQGRGSKSAIGTEAA
ncbi:MAG: sterol desaturase family protein [Parvibaculum sp.]